MSNPRLTVQADEAPGRALVCWNCRVPSEREHSVCGSCGKIQLATEEQSYFALLELAERYDADLDEMEQAFHRLSRTLHPDRFAGASALERRLAVQRTTLLNDAYRTLRDPLRRGTYLLQREGVQRGEESGTKDPELLMEILEGRERVQGLKAELERQAAGALDDLANLRAEFEGKVRALYEALAELFRRYDAGEKANVLSALTATIDKIRYFGGIKGELDQLALQARQLA
jgi:molecular chaperone HscB